MFECNVHGSCHGCCHGVDRRRFIQGCATAAVAAAGGIAPLAGTSAAEPADDSTPRMLRLYNTALLPLRLAAEVVARTLGAELPKSTAEVDGAIRAAEAGQR